MQFVITKQIAVDADTPEDAVAKMSEGKTISINVQLRPQSILQGQKPVQFGPGGVPVSRPISP